MTSKIKMSNEGHEGKVVKGGSIGLVFIIGLVVGGIVTFFAVAQRTQGVIEQRRELLREKQAKAAGEHPETTPAVDGQAPAPQQVPTP